MARELVTINAVNGGGSNRSSSNVYATARAGSSVSTQGSGYLVADGDNGATTFVPSESFFSFDTSAISEYPREAYLEFWARSSATVFADATRNLQIRLYDFGTFGGTTWLAGASLSAQSLVGTATTTLWTSNPDKYVRLATSDNLANGIVLGGTTKMIGSTDALAAGTATSGTSGSSWTWDIDSQALGGHPPRLLLVRKDKAPVLYSFPKPRQRSF